MRLVEQRAEGVTYGECVRASWASLLGVPIDDVPDFSPNGLNGANQHQTERQWVNSLGFDLVVVSAKGDPPDVPPHVVHLMSGLSPRGRFGHRVVGKGGKLVWDPHPSHAGLRELWSYTFLVPLLDATEERDVSLIGFSGWL